MKRGLIEWEEDTRDGFTVLRRSRAPRGYMIAMNPDPYLEDVIGIIASHERARDQGVLLFARKGIDRRSAAEKKQAAQDARAACEAHAAEVSRRG